MKDQRQPELGGGLDLPHEPFFLHVPGGIHTVEVKANLPPGPYFGVPGQGHQGSQHGVAALLGIVGVNAHRGIDARVRFG